MENEQELSKLLHDAREKRFIQVSIKFDNNKNIFAVNDRFADLHQITNTYNDLIKQLTHNMLG